MIKRALWIIAIVLLLVVPAAMYWLLMTKSGFNTALNFTQQSLPALSIDEASGRLYDGIYLQGVSYEPEEGDAFYIKSIDARWQLWSLLSTRLIINQLHIDQLQIKQKDGLDKDVTVDEDFTVQDISLPLAIHLRSLRITHAEMVSPQSDITPLFDRFYTSLRVN